MKVSEERLNKLLNAFGHNCDFLFAEAYGGYCGHGVINNEPNKCRNCQFRNGHLIKEWLKEGEN